MVLWKLETVAERYAILSFAQAARTLTNPKPGPHLPGCRLGFTLATLPPQLQSLTPLHIAASLPGEEGVKITELLLHAITDVDAKAADQDDIYKAGKVWFCLDLQLCLLTKRPACML